MTDSEESRAGWLDGALVVMWGSASVASVVCMPRVAVGGIIFGPWLLQTAL